MFTIQELSRFFTIVHWLFFFIVYSDIILTKIVLFRYKARVTQRFLLSGHEEKIASYCTSLSALLNRNGFHSATFPLTARLYKEVILQDATVFYEFHEREQKHWRKRIE